jgi:outer membrane protein assembly factor BamB
MAAAHGGGSAGGVTSGAGMLTVADDGSLLVTEMSPGGMMSNPFAEIDRELVNIGADGSIRWRASFEDGVPMMPVTAGNLVVFTLRDDWWLGAGSTGDNGFGHGGDPGGGPGGGPGGDAHADTVIVVALDLESGVELWRYEADGDTMVMPQISPDGSRVFLTTRDLSGGDGFGDGPIHQGGAGGAHMLMSTSVVALDASDGQVLWIVDLAEES